MIDAFPIAPPIILSARVSIVPEHVRARPPVSAWQCGTIWIVLPAYNEAPALARLLPGIEQALVGIHSRHAIVVVDDGSEDGTSRVASEHAQQLPLHLIRHQHNQGLGATIRDGLQHAALHAGNDDIVIAMDADETHSPALIRNLVSAIRGGADVAIASRYRRGSQVVGLTLGRRLLSLLGNLVLKTAFPTRGVRDFTCGYRAYRASALRRAFEAYGNDFVSEDGFACMVDILLKLRSMRMTFSEVPLVLRYDFKQGKSKMRIFYTARKTMELIVRRRLEA